ncbi:site-specific integrase [Agrobacterium sp. BT-220-3]|nr:site-specific integrase [Agrobacterium sp. BT-220-3]
MVIKMPRPSKRKDSANALFRQRVPLDLIEKLKGKTFTTYLPVSSDPADGTAEYKALVSGQIKFSLRTADTRLVRIRHAAASEAVEAFYAAAYRGPQDLTHRETQAILGLFYTHLIEKHRDNPPASIFEGGRIAWSEFEIWDDILDEAARLVAYGTAAARRLADQQMLRLIDIDAFLAANAIELSERSRANLTEALPETLRKATATLKAYASGDYGPDTLITSYPPRTAVLTKYSLAANPAPSLNNAGNGIAQCTTFDELFRRWQTETRPAASTVSTWKGRMAQFSAFIGKTDPRTVDEVDAIRWKDDLIAKGRKAIQVGQIAALRRLYSYGVENAATSGITHNPFAGIKANQKKVAGTGRLPFTSSEVSIILSAARKEKLPHLRWASWLCAATGARIGEIAQLWGSMIIEVDGIPCVAITTAPDGGSIKNVGSERTIPIHPDLIAEGFLEYVRQRGKGPLFYREISHKAAKARDDGARKHKSKGVTNRVSDWVRGLGITDARKAPSHSWRHWHKSTLTALSVSDRLMDEIHGHSNRSAAAGYTHSTPEMMLEALRKIDLCALANRETQNSLEE